MAEASADHLWKEYRRVFDEFDDLTLARWLAQTLSQLQGRLWRFSHPLLGSYRLAAELGHQRQVWLKRLVNSPSGFAEAPCCRAPMLPLFTRDIVDTGLVCQHCSETMVPFDEIPQALRDELKNWAAEYAPVHAVAHWDDRQRRSVPDYDRAYDNAALQAEKLLSDAANKLLPGLLEYYPALVWEDGDECLEVVPEDILL